MFDGLFAVGNCF